MKSTVSPSVELAGLPDVHVVAARVVAADASAVSFSVDEVLLGRWRSPRLVLPAIATARVDFSPDSAWLVAFTTSEQRRAPIERRAFTTKPRWVRLGALGVAVFDDHPHARSLLLQGIGSLGSPDAAVDLVLTLMSDAPPAVGRLAAAELAGDSPHRALANDRNGEQLRALTTTSSTHSQVRVAILKIGDLAEPPAWALAASRELLTNWPLTAADGHELAALLLACELLMRTPPAEAPPVDRWVRWLTGPSLPLAERVVELVLHTAPEAGREALEGALATSDLDPGLRRMISRRLGLEILRAEE